MEPAQWIVGLALMVLGLGLAIGGHRFHHLFVGVFGFTASALAVHALLARGAGAPDTAVTVGTVMGGIAGAILVYFLDSLGLFLIGAVWGLLAVQMLSPEPERTFVLVVCLVTGFLALRFQKIVIVLATSTYGAVLAFFGLMQLERTQTLDPDRLLQGSILHPAFAAPPVFWSAFVAVIALGVSIQLQASRRPGPGFATWHERTTERDRESEARVLR